MCTDDDDIMEQAEVILKGDTLSVAVVPRTEIFIRVDGTMFIIDNDRQIDVAIIDLADGLDVE